MVVDDADSLRQLWRDWLALFGFEVVEATTGAEAVALATYYCPAAVIMDLAMPVMDGLEATRCLKRDPRTAAVPVLMVTAHTSAEHRHAAQLAGCAAFLPKPAEPHELLSELRRVLAGA